MARRAGVSPAEYRAYQPGTTFLSRQQNQAAFTRHTLHHQANQTADFMVRTGLTTNRPSLDGLFDDRFVKVLG